MFSIYETTQQGQNTRSQLLQVLQHGDGLTRNEIVAASNGTLTYEQVRRQTENLIFERQVYSRRDEAKQRRYYLRQNFTQTLCRISVSGVVIFLTWSVPVVVSNLVTDNDSDIYEKGNSVTLVVHA